jgi:lipooligosaccharide transport system permease protein
MAIARTAFPNRERVARQRVYWATNYKRTWKGSAVSSFVAPLFYVVAMGVLLGGFVDDSTAGTDALGGAPSYLAFVAPGLAAAHAMQIATGETTWPVMGNLKWHRTYYAMVATPLTVPDVVAAHLSYVAFRLAITTGVFLLVLTPFGVFASLTGVLLAWPVLVLVGMSFAGFMFAYSSFIKNESGFAVVYRLMVIPMFLFSGAFFPIENLGPVLETVARFTPLWHGVDLTRMLLLDQVRPEALVLHLVVLVVLAVSGALLAAWQLTRRMAD